MSCIFYQSKKLKQINYNIHSINFILCIYILSGIADQNIVGICAFLPWLAKLAPDLTGYSKGLKLLAAPEELARDVIGKHIKNHVAGDEKDFIDMTLTKIYNTVDTSSPFFGQIGRKLKNLILTLRTYLQQCNIFILDFLVRNLHYTLLGEDFV